jgi:DNA repair exonuclease SbcCD ATPase subunit
MTRANSPRKKASTARASAAQTGEAPENLDKVRDILFGGQMRVVDKRLAALEERFKREVAGLRKEHEKRLSGIEGYMKKELESLTEKLKVERSKRVDDLKALSSELKDGSKDLENRLAKLGDTTSKADADVRSAILEQAKSVTEQLTHASDALSDELQRAVNELRADKLDTATVIQLFSDMALHLTEDLQAGPEQD